MKSPKEIYSKIRKYWWLTNTLMFVAIVILMFYLESTNEGAGWLVMILFPFFYIIGVDLDTELTRKEILKIAFLLSLIAYSFFLVQIYFDSVSLKDFFSLETLKMLGYVTIFMAGVSLLGIIPVAILKIKDRMFPRKRWVHDGNNNLIYRLLFGSERKYDASYAADYIYKKLPDSIIQKTTQEEIGELLITHNPVSTKNQPIGVAVDYYSKLLKKDSLLEKQDIEKIIELRDKYKKSASIVIPVGYKPPVDL